MIASLRGIITYKSPSLRKDSYFVVEAGGVGYKVYSPQSNLQRVEEGQEVVVFTYLAVSEHAMDLYGFLDPADKTFFTLLLEVPGIGPKSAIGILGKTTMSDVQQAIFGDDPTMLTKVSGLGQKTAEKIIITLKDKVESLSSKTKGKKEAGEFGIDTDVFDALVSFGYTAVEARKALGKIDPTIKDTSQKIKEALKILGK